jgi:hypothetical protein
MMMKAHAAKLMEVPIGKNPISKLWQKLGCNTLLLSKLLKFMKLFEIVITTSCSSYKDERIFSNLAFVKNRVWNHLDGHLADIMKIYL